MKRLVAITFALMALTTALMGCGKKDVSVDKAPPVGDDARPDPANPNKMNKLPPAIAPIGGGATTK